VTDHQQLRSAAAGQPPLTGRLEPWLAELLADPATCAGLLERFGSPVNVIDPAPLVRNAAELVAAGAARGVEVRVRFARKANKALALVDAALAAGHGVDVASLAELAQVLQAGAPPERVILSAAVKPPALLDLAVRSGVTSSLDTVPELEAVVGLARSAGRVAPVAPRLAPQPGGDIAPSRFGELAARWREALGAGPVEGVAVVGVHVHLGGYRAADRVAALAECLDLVDQLTAAGHRPTMVDLGGGVPMSYLDDEAEWDAFWTAQRNRQPGEELTWRDRSIESVYPYWQAPVRGDWLAAVLDSPLPGTGTPAAVALRRRGLALQLEPGRALLDGCGATLASVAFVKTRSDGVPLVGLAMNRTQCRSTSDDFLVDPVLLRRSAAGEPVSGFLVGAYCVEDELILLRRLHFPRGVAPGDVIALVNTGGYLMHILESASHQIPLARNLVRGPEGFALDRIDLAPPG
jgi:diaminopimelate decarboxylase